MPSPSGEALLDCLLLPRRTLMMNSGALAMPSSLVDWWSREQNGLRLTNSGLGWKSLRRTLVVRGRTSSCALPSSPWIFFSFYLNFQYFLLEVARCCRSMEAIRSCVGRVSMAWVGVSAGGAAKGVAWKARLSRAMLQMRWVSWSGSGHFLVLRRENILRLRQQTSKAPICGKVSSVSVWMLQQMLARQQGDRLTRWAGTGFFLTRMSNFLRQFLRRSNSSWNLRELCLSSGRWISQLQQCSISTVRLRRSSLRLGDLDINIITTKQVGFTFGLVPLCSIGRFGMGGLEGGGHQNLLHFEMEKNHNGRWTEAEHDMFLQGLQLYGKNWKKIEQMIGSRTGCQIRSHAQKFFLKLKADSPPHPLSPLHTPSRTQPQSHFEQEISADDNRQDCEDHDTQISFLRLHLSRCTIEPALSSPADGPAFDFWSSCIQAPALAPRRKASTDSLISETGEHQWEDEMRAPPRSQSFVPFQINSNSWQRIEKLRTLH